MTRYRYLFEEKGEINVSGWFGKEVTLTVYKVERFAKVWFEKSGIFPVLIDELLVTFNNSLFGSIFIGHDMHFRSTLLKVFKVSFGQLFFLFLLSNFSVDPLKFALKT